MKQRAKDVFISAVRLELERLNKEIIAAAKDGDIVREDIEAATIDTLKNVCHMMKFSRAFDREPRIETEETADFSLDFDGVGSVRQYTFVVDGEIYPCNSYIFEKERKGA